MPTNELEPRGSINRIKGQALVNINQFLKHPEASPLWQHQLAMIEAARVFLQSEKTGGHLIEPTGVGKSAVMVTLANLFSLKAVILSPTQQILRQNAEAAKQFAPELNMSDYYTEKKDLSGCVINTTYQSMTRLLKGQTNGFNPSDIQLVICDELHTALGEERHTIFRHFPGALKIGTTATPYFDQIAGFIARGIVRSDEDWLELFNNCIHEMTLEEAIEAEILAPLNVHLLQTHTRVKEVSIRGGDYTDYDLRKYLAVWARNIQAVAVVAGTDKIPAAISVLDSQKAQLEQINKSVAGKQTVVFCIDIAHAEEVAQSLRDSGIAAEAIHGKIHPDKRQELFERYEKGDIQVVTGVDMLGIGWDSPKTKVSIHLGPTLSAVKLTQQVGRILRRVDNQEATAVQFVDQFEKTVQRPTLISDLFDPEYVLRGTQLGKEPSAARSKSEKVNVTFSGMDIEGVYEELKVKEHLQQRFKQASLQEINEVIDSIVGDILNKQPGITTLKLYQELANQLSGKLPSGVHEKVIQSLASLDTNTRQAATKALFFLNAKTLLSAVDLYYTPGIDSDEEKQEMLLSAIQNLAEKVAKLQPNTPVTVQIHNAATLGIKKYLSSCRDVPPAIVANPWLYRLVTVNLLAVMSGRDQEVFRPEVEQTIDELSKHELFKEVDNPVKTLRDYAGVLFNQQIEELPEDFWAEFKILKVIEDHERSEVIYKVLESLPEGRKAVLVSAYGLEDGRERTLNELAIKFGFRGPEGPRQLIAKVLKHLRHPSRARKLSDFRDYDSEEGYGLRPFGGVLEAEAEARREISDYSRLVAFLRGSRPAWWYTLDQLSIQMLKKAGAQSFIDLFQQDPAQITKYWPGEKVDLKGLINEILRKSGLKDAYREIVLGYWPSDTELVMQIAAASLMRSDETAKALLKSFPASFRSKILHKEQLADMEYLKIFVVFYENLCRSVFGEFPQGVPFALGIKSSFWQNGGILTSEDHPESKSEAEPDFEIEDDFDDIL